jgi:hypothetical protein
MPWIRRISRLSRVEKEGIFRILIPHSLYHKFGIDPLSLCNAKGEKVVRLVCPEGDRNCLVEIKLPAMEDPLYAIQLSDSTDFTQINWDFLIVNDPHSPRFNTYTDQQERDTLFGWASRNLAEEERAMEAGLFPGQVRKGMRLSREAMRSLEFFCRMFDIKSIRLEALFYHNAVTYERYGFSYFTGYNQMKRIHELFQPGEVLFNKLDSSTPFRKPEFARTIRGRSWAIHDGILNGIDDEVLAEGWQSPVMYQMVGKARGMITFPDPVY